MYRFPWYLTLVSTNHASNYPGQIGLLYYLSLGAFKPTLPQVSSVFFLGNLSETILLNPLLMLFSN